MKRIRDLADKFSARLAGRLADKFADQLEDDAPDTLKERGEEETIPPPPPTGRYPITEVPYTIPAGEDPAQSKYRDPILPPPPRTPKVPSFSRAVPSGIGIEGAYGGILKYFDEMTFGQFLADKFQDTPSDIISLEIAGIPIGVYERGELMTRPTWGSHGQEVSTTIYREIHPNVRNVSASFEEFLDWIEGSNPAAWSNIHKVLKKIEGPSDE